MQLTLKAGPRYSSMRKLSRAGNSLNTVLRSFLQAYVRANRLGRAGEVLGQSYGTTS